MKERPILFTGPMVRAILDGSKTQTRRIAKEFAGRDDLDGILKRFPNQNGCPHGQPGDRLWVRESYRFTDVFDADSPARVGDRCIDAGYSKPWAPVQYDADGARRDWRHTGTPPHSRDPQPGKGRPSIHMPRWASRILLEIVLVRVERLQDISETDVRAEGVEPHEVGQFALHGLSAGERAELHRQAAVGPYSGLWDRINGAGSWDANPWVWVVEFKRVIP